MNALKIIEKIEVITDRNKIIYKGYRKTDDFAKEKTIRAFGVDIKNGDIMIDKANGLQIKLAQKKLNSNTKPRNPNMAKEKSDVLNNAITLLKGREMVYNGFENGTFLLSNPSIVLAESEKSSSSEHSSNYYEYILSETKISGTRLNLLTPKQMLQRLTIALAQIKAGNTSENLLNEIRQIIYSLHQGKEITKKVDYYIIYKKQIKRSDNKEVINMLLYKILAYTIHGKL